MRGALTPWSFVMSSSNAFSALALGAAMTVAFLAGRGTLGPSVSAQGLNGSASTNLPRVAATRVPVAEPPDPATGGTLSLIHI